MEKNINYNNNDNLSNNEEYDPVKIFYEMIIPEAAQAKITANDFELLIAFNTIIEEDKKKYEFDKEDIKGILVPTLYIKDKRTFELALRRYFSVASKYYTNEAIVILSLLFVDASTEDYNNPVEFINRKTNYLLNAQSQSQFFALGYLDTLGADLFIKQKKASIYLEAPMEFIPILTPTENASGYNCYNFPAIRYGIDGDTAYIYAVQSKRKSKNEESFQKEINRKLYKIGEGFDSKKDNYETYGDGNLKDVSASFVVALTIFLGYLNSIGINNIKILPLSISSWNNKRLSNIRKNFDTDGNKETLDEIQKEHDAIQMNITNKLIRTFLRICHHFDSINVTSYPFENDSYLQLFNNGENECNNSLLRDVYSLSASYGRSKIL